MVRKSIPGSKPKQSATKGGTRRTRSTRQVAQKQDSKKQRQLTDRPQTSPDLFVNSATTSMASAMPIWGASSILTQRKDLPWSADPNGKLCYAKDVENGKGVVLFWVTEDLEHEYPATLAGAAALAVIDTFDIRAACMHLIYAAHATQLDRPWEQELVIDDRQIEAYLGLQKRTDKNRQQKLALIKEIAQQPCKITTYVSWPAQGKAKGFTVEEGRLWHLLGIRYHYQQDLFGNKELTGITFTVRAGLWAKYFLNDEGRRDISAYCLCGELSKALLEDIMSLWQHREGAARLMVWLLFKSKIDRQNHHVAQTLMEIAYGSQRIEAARQDSQLRKKLANSWDENLLALHDKGWQLYFHPETYPPQLRPPGFGRSNPSRPKGFFDQLLSAQLWIDPPESWKKDAIAPRRTSEPEIQPVGLPVQTKYTLTGAQIKARRKEKGWSQPKLSALSGLSQGLISLIENEKRSLTSENQEILERTFALNS
ncbi:MULTISPECIES: helix-turn-helix domain-containing protein [Cyanophyceae]|uniref:helix-turn-helix domain-containing protein n=1 Tax=Cyanophyceae TaxID=3028117 RepID=UPI0002A66A27|nr:MULTISPECIES: helix-turn-helix transcriptional regulator [Cyanophyceae]AFZ33570.1 helix-turn-helix domain protein [Gloeocapsa sp. PCC 7428]PPS42074.1 transcriptional regulator [Chroococcidiopsis sp. TS-821]